MLKKNHLWHGSLNSLVVYSCLLSQDSNQLTCWSHWCDWSYLLLVGCLEWWRWHLKLWCVFPCQLQWGCVRCDKLRLWAKLWMTGWWSSSLPFSCCIFLIFAGMEPDCLGEPRDSKSKTINADRTKNSPLSLAWMLASRTCFEFLSVFNAA